MAWSWSHTQEAYDDARANLYELPIDTLRIIRAEWMAFREEDDDDGWTERYEREYALAARHYSRDDLIEAIWIRAEDQATCDNGGWNAWMCPYGCHTVPFSREEAAE